MTNVVFEADIPELLKNQSINLPISINQLTFLPCLWLLLVDDQSSF
jgi:hypothetical protein